MAEAKRHTVADVFDLYEPEILPKLKDPFNRIGHLTSWRSKIGQVGGYPGGWGLVASPNKKMAVGLIGGPMRAN
ncbi:MAG: hypothetical protein AAEC86_06695 [Pseudohongiellaceae bacterium]